VVLAITGDLAGIFYGDSDLAAAVSNLDVASGEIPAKANNGGAILTFSRFILVLLVHGLFKQFVPKLLDVPAREDNFIEADCFL
jgi:hypothetical protein